MKARQSEPGAVFHGRAAMEDAVRALVAALVLGLGFGAAAGAALALARMFSLRGLVAIPPAFIALRTVGGAASGAVIGALLAIVLYAGHRRDRRRSLAKSEDFIVTVKTPNDGSAGGIREVLALRGGDLFPAAP
jgi:prolipoprotein diacylglyceryltransferase